jgi:septal ring factor EnvC (AmiA/AmiB activator)
VRITRAISVAAATAALSLGTVPLAQADKPGSEPCAKQEQKVTKAEEALARVTEVFAHQKSKVQRLEERLAAATTDEERARIQAQLDRAVAKEQDAKQDKKAQQQRLAKAQERLDSCLAGQAD